MTHFSSTNTGGGWAVTFQTPAGAAVSLAGYTIEATVLSDINGTPVSVADGGLVTAVTGAGNNVLTWTLADGHGLPPKVYIVQTRYHTGDGNWKDLSKDQIEIAARGGVGSHRNLFAFNGSVATATVLALQGPPGADGAGVPVGGTAGQVLAKASNADGDVEWADAGAGGGVTSWNDIEDKPAAFPPSAHTHAIGDVTGLTTALEGKETAGAAASAVAAHAAAADPHPQYSAAAVGAARGAIPVLANASSEVWILPSHYVGYGNDAVGITVTTWRYKIPVYVPRDFTCTQTRVIVATAGAAGAAVRWGLRRWNIDEGLLGFGELVWQTGAVPADTTGSKTVLISDAPVEAGWYVFEIVTSNASVALRGFSNLSEVGNPVFGWSDIGVAWVGQYIAINPDAGTSVNDGLPADDAGVGNAQLPSWTLGMFGIGMR